MSIYAIYTITGMVIYLWLNIRSGKFSFCDKYCEGIGIKFNDQALNGYKESIHPMHVWINPIASTHDMTGKELTYINWMVLAIIFTPHNKATIKQNRFYIFD